MFTLPKDRERITQEPDAKGSKKTPLNPGLDWIGSKDRGGGKVPNDLVWKTNPKQWQEEDGFGRRHTEQRNEVVPPQKP